MSQETQIGSLNGGISDEDSQLVDSILNDLNGHSGQGGQGGQGQGQGQGQGGNPEDMARQMAQQQMAQQMAQQQMAQQGQPGQQELSPEQMRQIQMQRQMAMQQQQQMMQQQQMAQQAAMKQMEGKEKEGKGESKEMIKKSDSIIDQIKNESKSVILVIFLSIILNLEQVDSLFKSQPSIFTTEGGALNMQAIFVKALIIGAIFYVVKTYLL